MTINIASLFTNNSSTFSHYSKSDLLTLRSFPPFEIQLVNKCLLEMQIQFHYATVSRCYISDVSKIEVQLFSISSNNASRPACPFVTRIMSLARVPQRSRAHIFSVFPKSGRSRSRILSWLAKLASMSSGNGCQNGTLRVCRASNVHKNAFFGATDTRINPIRLVRLFLRP